ncbi:MAG: glycine oxidase ThiO, partial [Acidobacteria bacterium]|nr:glycine oxidase ThiO [Acidobacteriota bacterium]
MNNNPLSHSDVVVVGAGIVGLGIAWEALRTGRSVTLVDPQPASGATHAAAGMLAAVSELAFQEEGLLQLTLKSAALWPGFVADLPVPDAAATVGLRTEPTLVVGADAADRQALADLSVLQRGHGLDVESLTTRQARAYEPMLGPGLSAAVRMATDHQVDPRAMARQLLALVEEGGQAVRERVTALTHHDPELLTSPVTGVVLADGRRIEAGETVLANGLGAGAVKGLPEELVLPLRPVYGDILRLRVPESLRPFLSGTVRGLVHGVPIYVVPRNDGTVVIGATSREDGTAAVSAGGVYQLLRDAQVLVPAVAELELLESIARARPGTPDNAPLLGRVMAGAAEVQGLIVATGFYRHGVLLMPLAAHTCRQLMNGISNRELAAFAPHRFSPSLTRHPAVTDSGTRDDSTGNSSYGAIN